MLKGLSKSFSNIEVLKRIDLEVKRGGIVALRGESGAGKSTALYLAGGLLPPDRGIVSVGGRDLCDLSGVEKSAFRRHSVGIVFQDCCLLPYLDVCRNILIAGGTVTRAEELIESLGLARRRGHLPKKLSAGEQQRVALARALSNDPGLLLADEPTGNLDDENAGLVVGEMRRFAKNGGAVLVATHDENVMNAADRVITLKCGVLC